MIPRLIAPTTAIASHPSNEIAELLVRLTVLDIIRTSQLHLNRVVERQHFGHNFRPDLTSAFRSLIQALVSLSCWAMRPADVVLRTIGGSAWAARRQSRSARFPKSPSSSGPS